MGLFRTRRIRSVGLKTCDVWFPSSSTTIRCFLSFRGNVEKGSGYPQKNINELILCGKLVEKYLVPLGHTGRRVSLRPSKMRFNTKDIQQRMCH